MSRSCLATLRFVVVVLILGLWLSTGWSADDQATFEAFYTRQWDANWILIGVGALAGAGIVFWTGGAAGPVVGGVGTLIGDLMGLHGIAATNAGLAWLGGGSVASGGLGMAGGAAVLSGALTLGGDVATDYVFFTVGKAFSAAQARADSAAMTTLMLPFRAPKSSRSDGAMKLVEQARDVQADPKDGSNLKVNQLLDDAINVLRRPSGPDEKDAQTISDKTLLALLAFIRGDYRLAHEAAEEVYQVGYEGSAKPTLAAYIVATSSLLLEDSTPERERSIKLLDYALTGHPDDFSAMPRSLAVAVYLQRLTYRFKDDARLAPWMTEVGRLLTRRTQDNSWRFGEDNAAARILLTTNLLVRLRAAQAEIQSLATSVSPTIRMHPRTLGRVQRNLRGYEALLGSLDTVLADASETVKNSIEGRLSKRFTSPNWEKKFNEQVEKQSEQFTEFRNELPRLTALVSALEAEQMSGAKTQSGPTPLPAELVTTFWVIFCAGLLLVLGAVIWRIRRPRTW